MPESEAHAKVNQDLYPELAAIGGLPGAIRAALSKRMPFDVPVHPGDGRFTTAKIHSDRGIISVLLGAEKRLFYISVSTETHSWTSGSTTSLESAMEMISAWLNGASLSDLATRFPFMSYDPLAEAYEKGDPVETQWDLLLNEDIYASLRPLLWAVRANQSLRRRFPYISHGRLRLARDPLVRSLDEVWVTPLSSGAYRIETPRDPSSAAEYGTISDAVNAMDDCIRW
ncbi:DUF6193 family natural product biosynthesis protein [Planobispora takensis]|uniref:Uncharacterized protein n=1 Tax=Planobispora takensis TaxID=1367882 RepID=A0A8J3WXI7_9ACTN|nr:DUF6193 family natural product biosynthesis protein [Planobispora takensis]GII06084.1 hypothetical protein Pta02_80920 [Planobispora takensis]